MKVALCTWNVYPFHGMGGVEKYVFYLAKHLVEEGVEVEIITSLDRGKRRVEVFEGIKYVLLPSMCAWRRVVKPWILLFSLNLAKYLRGQRFDVVHSFTDTAYFYLHYKGHAPTIVQPFGMEPFLAPSFTTGLRSLYFGVTARPFWRYCLTRAEAIASEGEAHTSELVEFGLDKDKLFPLPQGVDILAIQGMKRRNSLSRRELGLGDDDLVLITVNRFSLDTGLNYLVDAFTLIKRQISHAKLIMIGKADSVREKAIYRRILEQINRYGLQDVFTLPNVEEHLLYGYYGVSDIFISPNIREGLLLIPVQEAMACGLPVVSTDQETLIKPGINGYIVPKRDPNAICQAVVKIYQEGTRQAMGERSQETIKDFDMKIIAKAALRQYERLALRGRIDEAGR